MKIVQSTIEKINHDEYEKIAHHVSYGLNIHPIWLTTYINTFGYGNRNLVLEGRDEHSNALWGFLPLVVQHQKDNRFITLRRLVPCGYRPTDYFPIPVIPGKEDEFASVLAKWFVDNSSSWDRLFLNLIPEENFVWKTFVEYLAEMKFDIVVSKEHRFLTLDASGTYIEHLNLLGTKKVKLLRYQERRLEREIGSLSFQILEKNLRNYFDEFLGLYSDCRKDANQSDPFKRIPQLYEFMREIIEKYERKRWIRLAVLACNDVGTAYCYHFCVNKVVYYSMPTYDLAYAKFSPGRVLLAKLIENAFNDSNIIEFNFMRSEYPYKLWWLPKAKNYVTVSVENNKTGRVVLNKLYGKIRVPKEHFAS